MYVCLAEAPLPVYYACELVYVCESLVGVEVLDALTALWGSYHVGSTFFLSPTDSST